MSESRVLSTVGIGTARTTRIRQVFTICVIISPNKSFVGIMLADWYIQVPILWLVLINGLCLRVGVVYLSMDLLYWVISDSYGILCMLLWR